MDNEELNSDVIFPDPEEDNTPSVEEQEKTWGDRLISKETNYRYETLAYMAASGMNQKAISDQIGMTQAWVCTVLSNTYVKNRVKEIQKEVFGGSIEDRFKRAMPQAMDVMEETINKEAQFDQRLKVDASKWILEKVTGKASQTVNHEGNILSDLISQLDQIQEGKTMREVEETIEIQANRDPMDEWILNNVPTHKGVGAKVKENEDGEENE